MHVRKRSAKYKAHQVNLYKRDVSSPWKLSRRSIQSNVCHQHISGQQHPRSGYHYHGIIVVPSSLWTRTINQRTGGCCVDHMLLFSPFFFFRWRLTRTEESRELDDAKVFIDTSARQIRKSPLIRDAIRSRHTPHETWSVELYKGGSAGNDNDACLSLKVIHLVYRHAPYDAYHFGGPRCNCVHSKKSGNHSSPCCKCQSIQHGPII